MPLPLIPAAIYGAPVLTAALTRFLCSPAGQNLVRNGGNVLARSANVFLRLINSNAGPQVIKEATKNFISLIRSNPAIRQDFQQGIRQALQLKNDIIPGLRAWFTQNPTGL